MPLFSAAIGLSSAEQGLLQQSWIGVGRFSFLQERNSDSLSATDESIYLKELWNNFEELWHSSAGIVVPNSCFWGESTYLWVEHSSVSSDDAAEKG